MKDEVPNLKDFDQRLRDEANEEHTLEVPQSEPTSKTQIIGINFSYIRKLRDAAQAI